MRVRTFFSQKKTKKISRRVCNIKIVEILVDLENNISIEKKKRKKKKKETRESESYLIKFPKFEVPSYFYGNLTRGFPLKNSLILLSWQIKT